MPPAASSAADGNGAVTFWGPAPPRQEGSCPAKNVDSRARPLDPAQVQGGLQRALARISSHPPQVPRPSGAVQASNGMRCQSSDEAQSSVPSSHLLNSVGTERFRRRPEATD